MHKGKLYKTSHCGNLLHMDIVGPFTASHVYGFKWILVVVDDHSRYKFIKLLKHKSEAYEKDIKCDNAGEFLSDTRVPEYAH